MTFALKDFEALKKHFNDTVKVLLLREKKDPETHEIKDLEKRREETLFLKAVLTELEARITSNTPRNLKPYAEIFYGAQALILQDIEDHRGYTEKPGLLHDRIIEGLGMESSHPDIYQEAKHFGAFNSFMKLMYIEGDSRNGLQTPNAMDSVPFDKLTSLITKGHQLEEAAQKKITRAFLSGGKTEAHANGFNVTQDIPASAIAQFTTFEALNKSLDDLRLKEIAHKNKVNTGVIDNKDRAIQFQSLLNMAHTLEHSRIKPNEKLGILAGTMLLVREQIGYEYGKTPFSKDDITETLLSYGSVIHTGLTEILKAKEMAREDAEALMSSARNFMIHMCIEHSDNKGEIKESIRTKHIFSNIEGFNLTSVLDFMQKLIKCSRVDSLNRCVTDHKKAIEDSLPKKPASSYTDYLKLGGWLGKKVTKEVAEDEVNDLNEEEQKKNTDASAELRV